MEERYCIKPRYRSNQQVCISDGDKSGAFWSGERIEATERYQYQYYVYRSCRDLVRSRGYKSVLDVGSGPPLKTKTLLAPYLDEILLIDVPSVLDLAKQILPEAQFMPVDLENIDLDLSRTFDLILCADVLEHLLDPDNCVRFVKRHLSPYGLAVFSTPERDYLRGRDCNYSPKPEHVREWNSDEFADYLASRGFELLEQFRVPQMRVSQAEFLCSRLLSRLVRNRRWSSCQVVVCR